MAIRLSTRKTEALACEVNGHELDRIYTVKAIHSTSYGGSIEFAELILQSKIQAEI